MKHTLSRSPFQYFNTLHFLLLPGRAIQTQTAVGSTITQISIKENWVYSKGHKDSEWTNCQQTKVETVRNRHKRTAFCMTVKGTVTCLVFLGEVGLFVWDVSRLGPLYTALSWSLSRSRLLHIQLVWLYDTRLTVMLMNALLAFTGPCVLGKVTSGVQPFTVLIEKAITSLLLQQL